MPQYYRITTLFILMIASCQVNGQAINNMLAFKHINAENYFRLSYENDYFSATDYYYTQGISFELVDRKLKKMPVYRLLPSLSAGRKKYGLSLEHDVYTPCSISSDAIIYGDRPFSACLFLKAFTTTIDSVKKRRVSASLNAGVIGPAAGAEEFQTEVHRVMPKNSDPHGWANQVRNDVILNYQVDGEQLLLAYRNICSIDVHGMIRLGTLSDMISIGTTFMFGNFEMPFKSTPVRRHGLRLYMYDHPQLNIIGYDATLQGGLFNTTSPYLITNDNMQRITFQNRFGFGLSHKGIFIEYFQSYITREFKTGKEHHWGGVQVAFRI